jgi:N-acetylglucosamine malate deacetylase 2
LEANLRRLGERLVRGRVVVVAAHPDDETIGAAGLLCRAPLAWVVHLTAGVPRDRRMRSGQFGEDASVYGRVRSLELDSALDIAFVPELARVRLGFVDQELASSLVSASRALQAIFEAVRPWCVVTHPYEGGHPDHDGTAFACWAALARSGLDTCLFEMTSYHGQKGRLRTGVFMNGPAGLAVEHDQALEKRKRAMLGCYVSQRPALAPFDARVERFRVAPRYRFERPPHAGALYYEKLGWPMTGRRFSSLARRAAVALGIREKGASRGESTS